MNPRIGIIIPTRSDRPLLLMNCLRMIAAQTIQPEIIHIVNYPAKSEACDITARYRSGYDALRGKNLDIIAFLEDDDWYSPDYLEIMVKMSQNNQKWDVFGLKHTIYYHFRAFKHFRMDHETRSSAMNTLIKPDLNIAWGQDSDPYTDVWLWYHLKGITVEPPKEICMGMKHGVGLCGGQNHTDHMERYINNDSDKSFLKATLDPVSFEFYANYFPVIKK